MKYVVTAEEMRYCDQNTTEFLKIPAMVLMERAALSVLKHIEEKFQGRNRKELKTLILCGVGNNGGDGLALARLMADKGYTVEVCICGEKIRSSAGWKNQYDILQHYNIKIGATLPLGEYNILIDALFGVGLSREITGAFEHAIAWFNKQSGYKLSIDMPSGIHSDTGEVLLHAVQADTTITFGFLKRGLVLAPGCMYAGEVICEDIGIREKSFLGKKPGMFTYDEEMQELLPGRDLRGNKGSFGKVLMIVGNENMAGAAALCAKACYRTGAGMVRVLTHPVNIPVIHSVLPEALAGSWEFWRTYVKWADVLVFGPGCGTDSYLADILKGLLEECEQPLVIDADGLNILAANPELMKLLKEQTSGGRDIVLTPHMGELSRMTDTDVDVIKKLMPIFVKHYATELSATLVSKDAITFTCAKGEPICVNYRQNSGLSTAGSGDVLTGIISALLAQGMDAFEAGAKGVAVHSLAGERAAARYGNHACMAGDIIEALKKI